MATIPYDSVQYCETDEGLILGNSVPLPIKNGEVYIGVYNFNPGYEGNIKTISFKTSVNWVNPEALPLSGRLDLKVRQYDQTEWKILDSYNFNSTEATSGEVDFSLILVSGEDAYSDVMDGINNTPLIIAVTGTFFDVGEELLDDELITNYNFASGEDNWTFDEKTYLGVSYDGGSIVPDRLALTGQPGPSSGVQYPGYVREPAMVTSDPFIINPGKRYKFTTYTPCDNIMAYSPMAIQDMFQRAFLTGLSPKTWISLSGETVLNPKAKDVLLYEWQNTVKR